MSPSTKCVSNVKWLRVEPEFGSLLSKGKYSGTIEEVCSHIYIGLQFISNGLADQHFLGSLAKSRGMGGTRRNSKWKWSDTDWSIGASQLWNIMKTSKGLVINQIDEEWIQMSMHK